MQSEEKAIALGVAIGRREAAERAAQLLRSIVAAWGARVAGRGFLTGNVLAGMLRPFVEDLEREALKIETGVAIMVAKERQARADLEAAKVAEARPKRWWNP